MQNIAEIETEIEEIERNIKLNRWNYWNREVLEDYKDELLHKIYILLSNIEK